MKRLRLSRKAKNRSPAERPPQAGQGTAEPAPRATPREQSFPVVGIGASAGGLEAFSQVLDHLPASTGLAFVLVQHLAPKHASALAGLLSRHSKSPAVEVQDGMVIAPNHVYVIPPNTAMAVVNGLLHLMPRMPDTANMPIDFFLQSLAEDRAERAIGVILSGTGSDGTLGLHAIKAAGGVTFAQDEKTAKYDSMPHSAIASGYVDFVLSPEEIARELVRFGLHPELFHPDAAKADEAVLGDAAELGKIFALLRNRTGVDFSQYKTPGIRRRMRRRMLLHKLETLPDYFQYLQTHLPESEALYEDILIHVTSFFREPQTFELLKKKVFPMLLKDRDPSSPVRVWVEACSTGEDAYSLLIVLLEYLSQTGLNVPIQAFATDVSERAVARAREGVYPDSIAAHVSPERLRRFFLKVDRGYQIAKSVRDSIIFARHDVTKDPPYSRLDIVFCRNLLMFLGAAAQRKVFGALHYALKPTGYLVLGAAETVGEFAHYFTPLDRKHRVYAKKAAAGRLALDVGSAALVLQEAAGAAPAPDQRRNHELGFVREADRIVMENYGPPAVVVNQDLEVEQFRGHMGRYLDPLPGSATLGLLKIVRTDLLYDLRGAVQAAKKTNAPVRREGVTVHFNGQTGRVNLEVIPLKADEAGGQHFLVLFEEPPAAQAPGSKAVQRAAAKLSPERREIRRLEEELAAAKEYLRSSLEDQETINEELRSANEEVLSSNEELQTANEELETAKEELQSANEELTTLNEELQNRNQELSQTANDLRNVLGSAYSGIVLVDRSLRIRFFTPEAESVLKLIPADVGRLVADIRPALDIPDLGTMMTEVIEGAAAKELNVTSAQGEWYTVRIRPYLTAENKVEGAVIVLTDVTDSVRAQQALAMSEERFRTLVEGVRDYAILLLDPEGKVVSANPDAERVLGYTPEEMVGKHYSDFHVGGHEEEPNKELALAASRGRFEAEASRVRKDGSQFWASVITIPLRDTRGNVTGFSKVVRDISDRRRAEELARELSMRLLRAQDEEREKISHDLHDTAGPGLAALVMNLARVQKSGGELDEQARLALRESVALAKQCALEIRTVSYQLHPPLLEESGLEAALRWYTEGLSKLSGIKVKLDLPPNLGRLPKELEVGVFRIIQGALSNVQRHARTSTARVSLALDNGRLKLQVKDRGKGMNHSTREGLGIKSMRERVLLLGGQFAITSEGDGVTVDAILPAPGRHESKAPTP